MACYHPIIAWRSKEGQGFNGSWPLVFNKQLGKDYMEVTIPCGGCIGCKLDRSRMWAIRCVNEASMYDSNYFITLTYDNEHIPLNSSLVYRDFQLFIKKLRIKQKRKIRYFMCGEYGDTYLRPHYHAVIFNLELPDKVLFRNSGDYNLYTSQILSETWGKGYVIAGDVTFKSAAYIARYCIKGSKEDKAVIFGLQLEPEFQNMSRKPGIGYSWFTKYIKDAISVDKIIIKKGLEVQLPRYYNKIIEAMDKKLSKKLKSKRRDLICKSEKTVDRLLVKEEAKKFQLNRLKRSYENERNIFD
nr:MAG: replication initiator protein [Microviridae sp.]